MAPRNLRRSSSSNVVAKHGTDNVVRKKKLVEKADNEKPATSKLSSTFGSCATTSAPQVKLDDMKRRIELLEAEVGTYRLNLAMIRERVDDIVRRQDELERRGAEFRDVLARLHARLDHHEIGRTSRHIRVSRRAKRARRMSRADFF